MTKRKQVMTPRKADLRVQETQRVKEMVNSYQQSQKEEVPLRINEKLTVLVPLEKCNEKYRQWYINTKLL